MVCAVGLTALAQDRRRGAKARFPHPEVGDEIKEFELKDMDGKAVKLSQFRGEKIFVLELGACT